MWLGQLKLYILTGECIKNSAVFFKKGAQNAFSHHLMPAIETNSETNNSVKEKVIQLPVNLKKKPGRMWFLYYLAVIVSEAVFAAFWLDELSIFLGLD